MPLYTVPTTAVYRAADGDTRYFTAGTQIDMAEAVDFGMPDAEVPPPVLSGGPSVGGITYAIYKTPGTPPTYTAVDATGAIARTTADTATTSGLKDVIEELAVDQAHFHFVHTPANGAFTRFHLLDCPLGNEAWNGGNGTGQDHLNLVDLVGLTFSGDGWGQTILSNRTNVTAGADVEVLSFTNCQRVRIADLQLETCGAFKSSTDCLDFDSGCNILVERVRIIRAKSRAIVIDGGNANKIGRDNVIRDCIIAGRPPAPELGLIAQTGGLAANTYRYAVVWVDQDLGGVGVAGDTMPSDPVAVTTTTGSSKVDVRLPLGAYTCTARKVLRWDAVNGWRLLTTIANNTAAVYRDDGSATPAAYTITDLSTIPGAGIELLGTGDSLILGNVIDGVGGDVAGGSVLGTNQYGINLVRKATVPTASDRNRVIGNLIRKPTQHGIRIAGGSDNVVLGNTVLNPGTPATKAQGIRIEGIAGVSSDRNLIIGNMIRDNQDATSPVIGTPGASMNNGVTITSTNTPTANQVVDNIIAGQATTATPISDSGSNSVIRHEGFGRTTAVTTTYTALSHDTVILADATGGAFTITLPSVTGMNGKMLAVKKVDVSANAVTVARAGAATIDGATTFVLAAQYKFVSLTCNGTLWFVVGSN